MSSHAARDRAEEESYDWILAMDPLTGQPQLAARPDFLEEAQVGAIAAAEAYNDDDSGRDEWFLEGDPVWGQFVATSGEPSEPNAPALIGGVCARPGGGYDHNRGPRRHGFCCSACWRGEPYHAVNCCGQGRMVCVAGVASAAATLEALPAGPTRKQDLRQRATLSHMVRLPVAWKRNTEQPLAYVL